MMVTTRRDTWIRLAIMLLCACASIWLYVVLVRLSPRLNSAGPTGVGEVLSWARKMSPEDLDLIRRRTHGRSYAIEFIGCCAGLFALYGMMLWVAKGLKRGWLAGVSAALPAIFMGVLICAPVMLSSDVYAYSYYGRLLSVYGVDAHATPPKSSLTDPFLLGGYYKFVPSVYGPLWTVISAGLTRAGGSHIGLTLLMFRMLEVAAALGCGVLIWLILKRLAPERAALGMVLFPWNPLVVMESAMSGHNDTCMMALALLAVWLHLRGWKAGAVLALALSALVKVITWPLVALYMLMVLRRTNGWKERALFIGQAGMGVAAAVVLTTFCARMSPNGLTAHTAGSADFYENNYHELVFKGLRRLLGEEADTLNAPMDFQTWWVVTTNRTVLHEGTSNKSKDLCRLKPEQVLLVLSNEDSEDWLRVYDPADRLQGYVDWMHLDGIDDPPNADDDPAVRRLSGWPPADWDTVITANRWIRVVTWSLFVGFGLLAAWKTTDIESFLVWGTAFFLASQLLVFTRIWPWYLIWPLAFGALKPTGSGIRLAVLLSAGMMASYALLDYVRTPWDWVYEYRSIPTIVVPVAVFAFLDGRFRRRDGGRVDSG